MIRAKDIFLIIFLLCFPGYGSETAILKGIWVAAANGSLADVQKEIAKGGAINAQDEDRGYTPLMYAIEYFQTHLVEDLLKLGAEPNPVSAEGYTALSLAARNADIHLMKILMDAGAKIDLRTDQFGSLVRQTLYSGSAEAFQLLLDAGFEFNRSIQILTPENTTTANTTTPMHIAANKGNTEVVELMVKNGTDINSKASLNGNTPLILAIGGGHPYTVKRLIELGADMSLLNDYGYGAFDFASENLHEDCAVVLMKAGAPIVGKIESILSFAWIRGNTELVEYLTSKGLNLPAKDPVAALLKTVRANDRAGTKQLLSSGFYDFSAQAHCVLGPAAAMGNPALLDDLHSAAGDGERLNDGDSNGFSQLHYTVMGNHLDAMDFYLRNRTSTEQSDPLGQTPIMTAARLGKIDAIDRLLKAGAKLDKLDKNGLNVLDIAHQTNQTEAVAWLENQGLKLTQNEKPAARQTQLISVNPIREPLPSLSIALTSLRLMDEGWFQSQEASHDFCALLQSRLEAIDGLQWVERAEIAKVEKEIGLTNSGFISATQNLAIGQWIKADLILTGNLRVNTGLGRELKLHVVEAKRGDVLAERTLILQQPLAAPLTITEETMNQAHEAAKSAIAEARSRLDETKDQIVLAPLFINNRSQLTPRLDLPAARLIDHVKQAAQGKNIRLLNLLGSTDAYQEAELAISGLTQQNSEAWKQVADHYLWGWCEEIGPPETPFSEMPIRIMLELWSGGEETQKFTTKTTSPQLDAATRKLIEEALAALPKKKQSPAKGAETASKAMLLGAKHLIKGQGQDWFFETNQWKIQRWQVAVKILDVARFFSPNDPEIASYWLLERWNSAIYERADFKGVDYWNLENLSRRKADWDNVISRFGFEGFKTIPEDSAFLHKKPQVESSSQPGYQIISWFGVCYSLAEKFSSWNFSAADGMPPDKRRLLQTELASETAERYLKLRQSPLFKQAPPIQSMERLLPILPLETRLKVAKLIFEDAKKTRSKNLPFILFRASELQFFGLAGRYEEGKSALNFTGVQRHRDSPIFIKRALTAPSKTEVTFPIITSAFKTKAKPHPLQGPWGSTPLRIRDTLSGGFLAIMNLSYWDPKSRESVTGLSLWLPQSSRLFPIKTSSYRGDIVLDFLTEAPGEFWLSDKKNGMSRINLETREQVFFKEADGVPFQKAESGAAAGTEFFCVGETVTDNPQIAAFHPAQGWRLVPLKIGNTEIHPKEIRLTSFSHLLYAHIMPQKQVLVLDTMTGIWQKLPSKGLSDFYYSSPDASGLWVPEAHAISLLSAAGNYSQTIELPTDINWVNAILYHDGDWLWVALTKSINISANDAACGYLLAIHKPSMSYRGCVDFSFPCNFRSLIVTPKTLYPVIDLYKDKGASSLFAIDKAELIKEAASKGF